MITITIRSWVTFNLCDRVSETFINCDIYLWYLIVISDIYLISDVVYRIFPSPQSSWVLTKPGVRYDLVMFIAPFYPLCLLYHSLYPIQSIRPYSVLIDVSQLLHSNLPWLDLFLVSDTVTLLCLNHRKSFPIPLQTLHMLEHGLACNFAIMTRSDIGQYLRSEAVERGPRNIPTPLLRMPYYLVRLCQIGCI